MVNKVLVTGSTSGIGLAIARSFAGAGCDVALNSFTDSEADHRLAQNLGSEFGVRVSYLSADLTDGTAARGVVGAAIQALGGLDVLVNNAGIQHVSPVESFPVEKWDAIIALNLSSAFHTIAAAIPAMRAAGHGRLINIASAHGLRASPNKSAYVAAKHGLVGLTKTVALELAGSGVTCNAICPGFVLTPLVEKQIEDLSAANPDMTREEVERDLILTKQPSKQFASVEDIGAAALFLASDAASQITGTTLSIDGGWTAQ